jgi:adenine phosphoribosyltransferase
MSSPSLPAVKELGPNHVCLDQANADVRKIAKSLPWYGPKHSPHDVPSFYDVSGITENPEVFRMVVDFFVQRYKAQGAEGPTHIAGFDARGFLFGPPIALALNLPFRDDPQSREAPRRFGVVRKVRHGVLHGRDRHAVGVRVRG